MKQPETPLQKWKERRRSVTARRIPLQGQVCCNCGSEENLTRHHISFEPIEVVILCQECHRRRHVPDFQKLRPRKTAKSCNGKVALDKFYTPKEAAEKLGISLEELHRLVREGTVPPWDMPHGPRHKGWHGRTLVAAGHTLVAHKKQAKKAKPDTTS